MQDNSPVTQITNDAFAAVRIPEFKNLMLGRFTFIMSLRMMSTQNFFRLFHSLYMQAMLLIKVKKEN
jgi:hypothetical protein